MTPSITATARWPAQASFGGIVWLTLAATTLSSLLSLNLIDILFLLAPLVVVPLGLRLVKHPAGPARTLLAGAIVTQPFAATALVIAMALRPGPAAGTLAAVWLVPCSAAGLSGFVSLLQRRSLHPLDLVPAAALAYLSVGAGWLMVARLDIPLFGYEPTLYELTAVHFHYAGFAAALIAGLAMSRLRYAETTTPWLPTAAALLVVTGLPVVAVGILTWAPLELSGTAILATGVLLTAFVLATRVVPRVSPLAARVLLGLASVSVVAPMILAVQYALGRRLGLPALDIPEMARIHGVLNALFFSLAGLSGWTLARNR